MVGVTFTVRLWAGGGPVLDRQGIGTNWIVIGVKARKGAEKSGTESHVC